MLTSISPLGERARGNRFWVTAAAYAAGSLLGGAAAGAALGAVGSLFADSIDDAVAYGLLAAAAVVGVVLDVAGRLPTVRRQVDERWLSTYRGWVYGIGFGLQLGAGVVTIVTASTTYVALLAALLTGSPLAGAVVGATFGAARALPLLVTARVRSTDDLARLHRGVARAAEPAATATRAAQLAVAAGALVLLGASA
jgi:sulfite exporter TauE/SafE